MVSKVKKFGVGGNHRRVEDDRLTRGRGTYTDDVSIAGELHAVFVRSDYPCADFVISDVETARAMDGVRLILTASDVAELGPVPVQVRAPAAPGTSFNESQYPLICEGEVRKVGDVVAMVVAETKSQAHDAAEAIEIDYSPKASVSDVETAVRSDAPLVWPEFGTNQACESRLGNKEATDKAFAAASKTAKLCVRHNRLISNYMEPRAVLASYDPGTDRYTLILPSQGVHVMREMIAEALRIDQFKIRVRTYDVGGGFGPKYFAYRDYPLVAFAAKKLGTPVKWTATRMEHFVADAHGRDVVVFAEMALTDDGRILGMRSEWLANLGAYMSQYGSHVPENGATMAPGVYNIPASDVVIRAIYTNTTPTDAYRGAGRPEATLTVERLMDEAARVCGLEPEEIRRINYIRPEQMPFDNGTGRRYDSGEFELQLDAALTAADRVGFADRLEESRRKGKLRGIGIATYIEACAFAGSEDAHLSLTLDGQFSLKIGTQNNGQGHQTVYGQMIAEIMGVELSCIEVRQGDSDELEKGGGTAGSRSIPIGVPAVSEASEKLSQAIRAHVAQKFDVALEDVTLSDGLARIDGTNKTISFTDLAAEMQEQDRHSIGTCVQPEPTYPNGTHVCEVEVCPDTGETSVQSLVIVDDFGVVVNPVLLEGQIQGGVAQGLGQAMMEAAVYDGDGQLLTASFMDYAMPRATDIPSITLHNRDVPCLWNDMGIKGAGEAGTIGATPAIANAIVDALYRAYGVRDFDLPATPHRVWRAIQSAEER